MELSNNLFVEEFSVLRRNSTYVEKESLLCIDSRSLYQIDNSMLSLLSYIYPNISSTVLVLALFSFAWLKSTC